MEEDKGEDLAELEKLVYQFYARFNRMNLPLTKIILMLIYPLIINFILKMQNWLDNYLSIAITHNVNY